MSEISLDVDLPHSRELVWRALTDRRMLDEWFMQSDMEPREGATFHAYPLGIAGFTGPFEMDLIEVAAPHRLHLRMRGDQLHVDMIWEIEEQGDGCRLRVSQTGFLGVNYTLRRRELRQSYQRIFGEALPAMLTRIAAGEADLGGSVEALHTGIPRQRAAAQPVPSVPEPASRRRHRGLAVVVTSLMVVAVIGWLWATRPRASDPIAGGGVTVERFRQPAVAQQPGDDPSASPSPGVSGIVALPGASGSAAPRVVSTGPAATPGTAPTTGPLALTVPLSASYSTKTQETLGVGYVAKVTTKVKNPGTDARDRWTVVMIIPDGAEVSNKSPDLVNLSVSGGTVTITPTGLGAVAGNDQVVFVFYFSGGSLPGPGTGSVTGCSIDGTPCSGS